MDERYQQALDGALKSPEGTPPMSEVELKNGLVNGILAFWADSQGRQLPLRGEGLPGLHPGEIVKVSGLRVGWQLVFRLVASGGLVCVLTMKEEQRSYTIGSSVLTRPNDIGMYPRPTKATVIPVNSPRVMVGNGVTLKGKLPLTREQFWRRGNDSYMLAPGEKRTISLATTSGMQQTSSEQKVIEASLGLSASAGYGPVSAGISASLSVSSQTFQQYVISSEVTHYESQELRNESKDPQMFITWQLTDLLTVFGDRPSGYIPIASIVMVERPVLVTGPYNPNNLPAAEVPAAATAEELDEAPLLTKLGTSPMPDKV